MPHAVFGVATNLLTRDVRRSAEFYKRLCGLAEIHAEPSYIVLSHPQAGGFQLGLIDWVSELVPRAARGVAEGTYLVVMVDDVAAALEIARLFEVEIIEETAIGSGLPPRAIIRDLDGRVIDLCTQEARFTLPPRKHVA